jgi:hypothetical protein
MLLSPPLLNALPVIITEPGDYVTRDGRRATIYSVNQTDPKTTSFSAKGAIWNQKWGVHRPKGYDIWHVSGRKTPLKEMVTDIVAKWEEKSPE